MVCSKYGKRQKQNLMVRSDFRFCLFMIAFDSSYYKKDQRKSSHLRWSAIVVKKPIICDMKTTPFQ